jgi:hypothetical protein
VSPREGTRPRDHRGIDGGVDELGRSSPGEPHEIPNRAPCAWPVGGGDNARRLHSSIAYLTPNEKEAAWQTDRLAA